MSRKWKHHLYWNNLSNTRNKHTTKLARKFNFTITNSGSGFNSPGSVKPSNISTPICWRNAFPAPSTSCPLPDNSTSSKMSSKSPEVPNRTNWEFLLTKKFKFCPSAWKLKEWNPQSAHKPSREDNNKSRPKNMTQFPKSGNILMKTAID